MSVTIAYVPDQKILGLSKVSRIAGYFTRRWQNQERTAHLIAFYRENGRASRRGGVDRRQTHVRDGARCAGYSLGYEGKRNARGVSERPQLPYGIVPAAEREIMTGMFRTPVLLAHCRRLNNRLLVPIHEQ